MLCPLCGYVMSAFDKECQRCHGKRPSQKLQRPASPPPKAASLAVSPPPFISQSSTRQTSLICPKCKTENSYPIVAALPSYNLVCPSCNAAFLSRIVKIRAKRSRGNRSANRRDSSVRVYAFDGREDLIEFVNAGYHDFELRASDIAIFTYLGSHLKIIQNTTINRYFEVSAPSCYLATYIYGPTSVEVALLRHFRDVVLLNSVFLSGSVGIYYRISSVAVSRLGNNKLFRSCTRIVLIPVVRGVRKYLLTNSG